MAKQKPSTNDHEKFLYEISIPYFGNLLHKFGCNLAKLIRRKFDISIAIHYKIVKAALYFQLKSNTPSALVSNVVNKFTCLHDANMSYIDMTSRHLIT